jgi:ATP-dependent Clp protease ATP-binding subunit ClpC
VDFRNTVVIMTSNLGARQITEKKSLGFSAAQEDAERDYEAIKSDVMGEVKRAFRPEFLNRVDELIVFHQLNQEHIQSIAGKMLSQLTNRLMENGITADFTEAAIIKIAQEGFDPIYGARPLRRAIQNKIEDAIAEEMLSGNIKDGDTVEISVQDDVFVFGKKSKE